MKKFLSLVLSFTMIAALLIGFVPASAADDVNLVVWESVGGPDQWIQAAGEEFTKINPKITVEFVNVELNDSSGQIALDGPAGIGPDLFAAGHDKIGELVTGGHILPTVNPEAVQEKILGATSLALTYDGVMYGYPTSAETYGLYFNKDLISEEEIPATWDELKTWTAAFNEKNPDKNGFLMDVGNMYYTILFTTMNGNRLFGESGTDTSSSYLATDNSIAGMKVFQGLREVVPLAAADANTATGDGAFAAGNVALYISGPWNVAGFTDAGINFGVTTLPSLDGETPAASFSGTRGMYVSAYSDHPEEAAMFAEFLISEEMQQLRYDMTGALPSIPLEVESETSNGFIAQLDYAFPMPSVPAMSAFWESAGAAASNIWDGADVATEMTTLDSAILYAVAQ